MDDNNSLYKKDNIEVTLDFEMVPMTNAFHHASANDNAPSKKRRWRVLDRILPIVCVAAIFVVGSTLMN
jgi:hypothetical protein